MDPNSNEAKQARARLEAARDDLHRSIAGLGAEYIADGAIAGSADAAAHTASAEENRELRNELEAQLREVEAALGRIDDGTYGIDENPGEPITPARLEAIPTARTNV